MKKLLLLLATMLTLTAKSQTSVYHPFPDSNAIWRIETQGVGSICMYPPYTGLIFNDAWFSLNVQGDTMANGYIYHKLYQSGVYHEYCSTGSHNVWSSNSNAHIGAYRQDTAAKQIFLMGSPDILLYDFSLNVGDTVPGGFVDWMPCASVITSIDSILIGNNYRKRFNLSVPFPPYSLIEGIGSTSGLFEPLCPFEHFGTLICFAQNGQALWPDTNTVCEIVTHVNEIQNKSSAIIFPNPFSDELNFMAGNNELSEIILYDIASRKILQQEFKNSVSLNTEQLEKGVYLYEVKNKNGVIKKGKVVKE